MAVERKYNLPSSQVTDSGEEVKNFFDNFFLHQISFPSNQIDAVIGFFLKRGFDEQAARSTCIVLLNQARLENINPLSLLDTLKGLTDVIFIILSWVSINSFAICSFDKVGILGWVEE